MITDNYIYISLWVSRGGAMGCKPDHPTLPSQGCKAIA